MTTVAALSALQSTYNLFLTSNKGNSVACPTESWRAAGSSPLTGACYSDYRTLEIGLLTDRQTSAPVSRRRQVVFGVAVTLAGLAISMLCLMPSVLSPAQPVSLFSDSLQEQFFFDIFGWIGGCWLLCWVCAYCDWKGMCRVGQWLGIFLLCVDQVVLFGVWRSLSGYQNFYSSAVWLTPSVIELFFLGYFLAFFTMPALTISGRVSLTGLGTLAVLLPWLLGRDAVVLGTQVMRGYFG